MSVSFVGNYGGGIALVFDLVDFVFGEVVGVVWAVRV